MTGGSIDTTSTREIAAAPGRMALLTLGAAAFVAVGWFMTQEAAGTARRSADFTQFMGYITMAVFGLFMAVGLHRLVMQRGTVITISPAGLRDIRVSNDVVPWPAIAALSTWQSQGQRFVIVGMKPGEEEKLALSRIARWSRGANARLGADGLAIASQGTKIGHDELMELVIAYAERYGAA